MRSTSTGFEIAMFEEKRLVEFSEETSNKSFQVGDIYLGRVKKVVPGLNACFVDIGYEKDAFLHYLDLGAQFNSLKKFTDDVISGKKKGALLQHFKPEAEISKDGKIADLLTKGQLIMVQVVKEPISTKGPRLSSEVSIAGRYCVLVPFSDSVNVSKKLNDQAEKKRLKQIALGVKPRNFGVIIRTAAEGCEAEELERDIKELVAKWEAAIQLLRTAKPADRLVQEIARTTSMLRDLLNDSFTSIYLDDPRMHEEVKDYVSGIAPDKAEIVKLYKGKQQMFEHFGIDKQVKGAFGKNVTMPGGAYIIIEHTEALHVIDVNSGNRMKQDMDQENNALNTNLEAADEIARQLRLRDMGGIIVIDFIDMRKAANKKLVYERMRDAMNTDRAKHTVLPISKFGLLQITRQRVRPEVNVVTNEQCPMCEGTGQVRPSILLSDEIEAHLKYILQEQNEKTLELHLHPYLAAYFTNGLPSARMRWWLKYKRWVKIKSENSYHMAEYHFFSAAGEQINI
ncbi:MAG: ribonuclease E/G [Bacteroidia bacterium]